VTYAVLAGLGKASRHVDLTVGLVTFERKLKVQGAVLSRWVENRKRGALTSGEPFADGHMNGTVSQPPAMLEARTSKPTPERTLN
jgi:hypothetical protein